MCTGGLFPVVDLSNWLVQLVVTALFIAIAVLHLVKKTASKYFSMADANFEPHPSSQSDSSSDSVKQMCPGPGTAAINNSRDNSCVVCGSSTKKQCSGCKFVRYCSAACQSSHWKSGHKTECKDFQLSGKVKSKQSAFIQHGQKGSNAVALVPARVPCSTIKPLKEVLFPYEDFVELYKWNKPGFLPCGLINCGNSCFANVVLQCLSHTRPLVAYLVEKGHRSECRRNDWCFLCEFEIHIGRASTSRQPFSPLNILSRLPNIGGNLGYGKQEDAHEFMRFAIDTMQSVCLDEFGGEKFLHPTTQETTLIQHIFGGHLQSQVICSKCCNISNQYENMMDLTVEIQGDAASLEECLNQFTAKEQLHGDNKYKCDGCNDYVMAWKRLMIRRAPNILTIALKRFQSGRFGKLNKRVTFPETLDLSPYMIEESDGNDVYKLYAVVVHVDMLNASFFGHYICYTKDFQGNWYRIDDWKVSKVDLEEVLSEGAYMLLYSRVCPRPSCLKPIGSPPSKEQQTVKAVQEEEKQLAEHLLDRVESTDSICISAPGSSCDTNFQPKVSCTIQTDSFSSRSVPHDMRDDADMATDSDTSPFSSSEDMDVLSSQVSKSGEEIALASSACMDNGIASQAGLEQGAEADAKVLPSFSTTESSQCLEEGGDTIASCRNHNDSQDMVNSVDSKRVPSEKMESGNSKLADDGTKLKPLFTPGFLGKRPHGNSSSLRRRGRSTSSDLGGELAASGCYQRETGLANGSRTKKDVQSKQPPPPECNGLSSLTMVNGLSLDGGEGSGDDHDNREKPPARRYKF